MTAVSDTEASAGTENVVSHPPFPFWLGTILLTGTDLFDGSGDALTGFIILTPSVPVYISGWGVLEGSATLAVTNGVAAPVYIACTDTSPTPFTYTIYQRLAIPDGINPAPITGVTVAHTLGASVDISALL